MKRWGLTFQRPDKRAAEQDPEAVRCWNEETWPKIHAKAQKDGGEVLFADQVGIRSGQVTGRIWGESGKTPVVRRSGNRFSVNAMSAISTKGRMYFMVFTAEVMCRFLDRLAAHFDRNVHLVVDGHSAHRSRKVRDWLAAHPDAFELHFLPPYSSELIPDDLVNADLKHSLPKQHRARDQAELAVETRRFFCRRQRQPHLPRLLRRPAPKSPTLCAEAPPTSAFSSHKTRRRIPFRLCGYVGPHGDGVALRVNRAGGKRMLPLYALQ